MSEFDARTREAIRLLSALNDAVREPEDCLSKDWPGCNLHERIECSHKGLCDMLMEVDQFHGGEAMSATKTEWCEDCRRYRTRLRIIQQALAEALHKSSGEPNVVLTEAEALKLCTSIDQELDPA